MNNDGNYSFFSTQPSPSESSEKLEFIVKNVPNSNNRKIIVAELYAGNSAVDDNYLGNDRSSSRQMVNSQGIGDVVNGHHFVPHPPNQPKTRGDSPSDLVTVVKGKKRNYNDSPRTGSDDEREMGRKHLNRGKQSLPPIAGRSSSLTSLDSNHSSNHDFSPNITDYDQKLGRTKQLVRGSLKKLKPLSMDTFAGDIKAQPSKSKKKGKRNKITPHVEPIINQEKDSLASKSSETLSSSTPSEELERSLTRKEFEKIDLNSSQKKESLQPLVVCNTDNDAVKDQHSIPNTSQQNNSKGNDSDSSSYTSVSSASSDSESCSDSSDDEAELRKNVNKELTKNLQLDSQSESAIYESIKAQRTLEHKYENSGSSDSVFNDVTPRDNKSSSDNHYDKPDDDSQVMHDDTGIYESITYPTRTAESQLNKMSETGSELSLVSPSQMSGASQNSLMPKISAKAAREPRKVYNVEEFERYFPDHKISLFVATWNMHGEKEVPYLDELLLPPGTDYLQDMYILGTQESTTSRREWEVKIQETLGPSHVLMYSNNFGVLHLVIYIRRELVWFCSTVQQSSVSTRPGHMIKTKGALGVCFTIFGTSFLFIVSHFTSDEGKVKDRIADYSTIIKSLALPQDAEENGGDVTKKFDRVFWLGDFNFRVDMERKKVDNLLLQYQEDTDPDYQDLLDKDQLLNEMQKGAVFHGFEEAIIRFYPSYKLDIMTSEYDTSSKMRVPSWTDRILYKSPQKSDGIKCLMYNSTDSLKTSDHRPVYGIFEAFIEPSKSGPFTGGQFVRDVYIEANKRRHLPPRHESESSVCTIL